MRFGLESLVCSDKYASRVPVVAYVMLGRLAILGFVLIALTALTGVDDTAFYAFIALAFVVTIPYALWLRNEESARQSARLGFLVDVLIVSGVVHYTGGISSQLVLLYPLVILTAGIVGAGRLAIQATVFSILCYASVVVLEMYGILPYRGDTLAPYLSHSEVVQTLFVRLFFFSFFAAASSYLTNRCAYQKDQISRLRSLIRYVFDNVSVALFAVERDGRIAMANSAARRLFQLDADRLSRSSFDDLFAEKAPNLEQDDAGQRVWTLRRSDGSTFPGTFEASVTEFPVRQEIDGDLSAAAERHVVALWDMSRMLELQDKANESTRLKTAVEMALEMAQWIRNPLTAIKVADEFVVSMVGANPEAPATFSVDDLAALTRMCDVIAEETQRLESKVNELLRDTEQDNPQLAEIMDQAETWSRRLLMNVGR